jgi:predicted nucleotidyltransferase component of viral defense system
MSDLYPLRLADVESWAKRNGATTREARQRFVQFVLLDAIGSASGLRDQLSFKGGNALRFCYGSRRTTADLDFSAAPGFPDSAEEIRRRLADAVLPAGRAWGIALRVQRVRRNPPGPAGTHPTFEAAVGYAFPTDRLYATLLAGSEVNSNSTVPVEISINEEVCEADNRRILGSPAQIRCCALEDILAEKLRALLQQKLRHGGMSRRQDLHDIVRIARSHGLEIDFAKVRAFLLRKSAARNIAVTRSAFDSEVRRLASVDWDSLFDQFNPDFLPIDLAWQELQLFLDRLGLPDQGGVPR